MSLSNIQFFPPMHLGRPNQLKLSEPILGSIVVSIPACHAGDPGSIPGRGAFFIFFAGIRILKR